MAKVATPKQTGHGGPEFESKVAAYLLTSMLTQTNPFGKDGNITRIDFQVRADGWLFDDILLELNNVDVSRIAISVKSTPQFNNNGCATELNELLWDQYLCFTHSVFKKDADFLCVIESPISSSISTDLNILINQAKVQEPKIWQERLYTPGYSSKSKIKLYESLKCPEKITNNVDDDKHYVGDLLKCFIHVEMDFERNTSFYESKSVDLCRSLLLDKNITEARKLFERLMQIAHSFIKEGGLLDIKSLLPLIKVGFKLEGIPNYKSDWKKIEKQTLNNLCVIHDKLGEKVSIDRNKYITEIEDKLKLHPICIIQGISGSGKTVLAKEFATVKKVRSNIIWLNADNLDRKIEADFQLEHDLNELMQCVASSEAYLIIDGSEKVYQDRQKQNLALIINGALHKNSCWKVILTCPNEDLDFVIGVLYNHNININLLNKIIISPIDEEGFSNILEHYPQLGFFLLQRPLTKILSNLKLLDKLLFNVEKITALSQIGDIGETHLIDFIWESEIENTNYGIQKASFMKAVAEKQADQLLIGISTSNFDSANIAAGDHLKKEGFIRIEQQKILFIHDLYGDWARYQLLVSHTSKLALFLAEKHLSSSLWTRAIRLYGVSLLEKDITGKNWLDTFELFDQATPQSIIIQNLLLEAFYFSPTAYVFLIRQRDLLFKEEGKLFRKLLKLFLISATTANSNIVKIAKEHGGFTESQASVYERIPIIQYWPDILNFVHDNIDNCLQIDLVTIAEIANTWLSKSPLGFIYRKEAGDISLKASQFVFSQQTNGRYLDSKIIEPAYKGLLLGYSENELEVSELCLKICKRKGNPEKDPNKSSNVQKDTNLLDLLSYKKKEGNEWPDGPFEHVDSTFRKLCLETDSFLHLLYLNPYLGSEILLAVLIDEPHNRYLGNDRDDYAIHTPIGWYPPFFLRGPFLNFLRSHPIKGIEFVIKITNHATNIWLENHTEISGVDQSIILNYNNIQKPFYGNRDVYGWCNSSTRELNSLISILMAFEKFLFEEIDNNKSIQNYVQLAMNETNSLALVAIFIEAGKLQPKLFLNELNCILPENKFYLWDIQIENFRHYPTSYDWPKNWIEASENFNNRKMKVRSLKDILIGLFLVNKDFQKTFKNITDKWTNNFAIQKKEDFDIFLFQLIPQFKIENYISRDEQGQSFFEYNEPKEISETLKERRERSLATMRETQISMKMEMMIDEQLPFELAGAEYLWEKIQTWTVNIGEEDLQEYNFFNTPLINVISSISLLFYHENIWKEKHPEYLLWIKDFFETLIELELKRKDSMYRHGGIMDWNIKLTPLALSMWYNAPSDKVLRKIIAGIIVLFGEETTKTFFESAGKYFSLNDPIYIQTQNLFILYNTDANRTYKRNDFQPELLGPLKQKYLHDFIVGNIANSQQEWTKDIDQRQVLILLRLLPDLKSISDSPQRNYILFLLGQALDQTIFNLKENDDNRYIEEFDRIVLIKIAEYLPYLRQEENPDILWTCILQFGYLAPKAMEMFCDSFFKIHLEEESNYHVFIPLLNKMVQYTLTSSTWRPKVCFSQHEDFRDCVIGFSSTIMFIWDADRSLFFKETLAIYIYWLNKNKFNRHTITRLLKFIVTKSGEILLAESLSIAKSYYFNALEKSNQPIPEGYVYVGHEGLDDRLASALSLLWENKKKLLTNNEDVLRNYRDLLQYLVAVENIVGIELQQRLLF